MTDSPVHVYPLDEEHELHMRCFCGPLIERRDPVTHQPHRAPIVIHRDAHQRAEGAS